MDIIEAIESDLEVIQKEFGKITKECKERREKLGQLRIRIWNIYSTLRSQYQYNKPVVGMKSGDLIEVYSKQEKNNNIVFGFDDELGLAYKDRMRMAFPISFVVEEDVKSWAKEIASHKKEFKAKLMEISPDRIKFFEFFVDNPTPLKVNSIRNLPVNKTIKRYVPNKNCFENVECGSIEIENNAGYNEDDFEALTFAIIQTTPKGNSKIEYLTFDYLQVPELISLMQIKGHVKLLLEIERDFLSNQIILAEIYLGKIQDAFKAELMLNELEK